MENVKTITEIDAINFPQVADFVGQNITGSEWHKAISGEKFTVGVEKKDAKVEAEGDEAEAEAPKKVAKKSK